MKTRARYALVGVVLSGCGGADSSDHLDPERIAAASSSIVGGTYSPSTDDFVVFVGSTTRAVSDGAAASAACAGALVAPNLVLTAKHCVSAFPDESTTICDASGEPQLGSTGGFISARYPPGDIQIHTGVDAKKRFAEHAAPAARSARIIDDETPTLCSHDLAYVVLDRPVLGVPLAKLRLGARPRAGPMSTVALAGWGEMEGRRATYDRMRRGGIPIQRVGPPAPIFDATGSLGPRTFETGPGGAKGDSGGPAMDESSGAVLGVLARALNADRKDPYSPYGAATVVNVYMTLVDFGVPMRTAFAAADAAPWIEGRDAPGWVPFGEACASNLECEGALCDGAIPEAPGIAGRSGTCNVACREQGRGCPSGTTCGGSRCVGDPDAGSLEAVTADGEANELPTFRVAGGCIAARRGASFDAMALALAACAIGARRIRMRPRSRH